MTRRAIGRSLTMALGFFLAAEAALFAQPRPGSMNLDREEGPKDENDLSSDAIDRPEREAPRPGLDITDALFGYAQQGGLLAKDDLLLVREDGTVKYVAGSLAVEKENFTILDRISATEVLLLKQLAREIGFPSMPDAFEPEGQVIDGVDFAVAVRLPNDDVKTVWSRTGAAEDQGYTRLRHALESIVADVRSREMFELRSYPGGILPEELRFRVLADGRYRIERRVDTLPVGWHEGRLRAADRDSIAATLAGFDFENSRLCRGEAGVGQENEVYMTRFGRRFAVQFRGDTLDGEILPLLAIAEMVGHIAESVGL